jgi:hypothetical protein
MGTTLGLDHRQHPSPAGPSCAHTPHSRLAGQGLSSLPISSPPPHSQCLQIMQPLEAVGPHMLDAVVV